MYEMLQLLRKTFFWRDKCVSSTQLYLPLCNNVISCEPSKPYVAGSSPFQAYPIVTGDNVLDALLCNRDGFLSRDEYVSLSQQERPI
jgi:hypothetical protein